MCSKFTVATFARRWLKIQTPGVTLAQRHPHSGEGSYKRTTFWRRWLRRDHLLVMVATEGGLRCRLDWIAFPARLKARAKNRANRFGCTFRLCLCCDLRRVAKTHADRNRKESFVFLALVHKDCLAFQIDVAGAQRHGDFNFIQRISCHGARYMSTSAVARLRCACRPAPSRWLPRKRDAYHADRPSRRPVDLIWVSPGPAKRAR